MRDLHRLNTDLIKNEVSGCVLRHPLFKGNIKVPIEDLQVKYGRGTPKKKPRLNDNKFKYEESTQKVEIELLCLKREDSDIIMSHESHQDEDKIKNSIYKSPIPQATTQATT